MIVRDKYVLAHYFLLCVKVQTINSFKILYNTYTRVCVCIKRRRKMCDKVRKHHYSISVFEVNVSVFSRLIFRIQKPFYTATHRDL